MDVMSAVRNLLRRVVGPRPEGASLAADEERSGQESDPTAVDTEHAGPPADEEEAAGTQAEAAGAGTTASEASTTASAASALTDADSPPAAHDEQPQDEQHRGTQA